MTSGNSSVPHDPSAIPCSHENRVPRAKGPNSKGQPMAAPRIPLAALCGIEITTGENIMKIKGLVFISCLAAVALIASPALSKPVKKSASSSSRSQRTAARTTQVTSRNRYQLNRQNLSSHTGSTRYYSATRYSAARSYAGRQYSGTRYYSGTPRYGANTYYVARATITVVDLTRITAITRVGRIRTGATAHPGDTTRTPIWAVIRTAHTTITRTDYNASLVASVQRRLGQLGYYHGVVDGVVGPQTRGAIAAFENRNGLVVDARISRPLLDRLRLG